MLDADCDVESHIKTVIRKESHLLPCGSHVLDVLLGFVCQISMAILAAFIVPATHSAFIQAVKQYGVPFEALNCWSKTRVRLYSYQNFLYQVETAEPVCVNPLLCIVSVSSRSCLHACLLLLPIRCELFLFAWTANGSFVLS